MIVGLLHPGEMGAALGAELRANGHDVVWASRDRSPETAARAAEAGLRDVVSIAAVADEAEVLLSVVPPRAARETATVAGPFAGIYVDANAIAPSTVRSLATVQSRLVDGGIVGPPPREPGTTRLYLSGAASADVARLFEGSLVDARVLDGAVGAASALKVTFAAWSKGRAALLLAILAAARSLGVEESLWAEWDVSLPGLGEEALASGRSAARKGWRWVAEMEEIAAAFSEAGLPGGFHEAAADIFRRIPREARAEADQATLERVLGELRA